MTVHPFSRDHRQPLARSTVGVAAKVFPFPIRGPIAYAERRLFNGYKRQSWGCVAVENNGQETAFRCRSERDARWLAKVMLQNYADRRALDADPLASVVRQVLELPREMRHELAHRLLADAAQ